jgi:hypothetical protein
MAKKSTKDGGKIFQVLNAETGLYMKMDENHTILERKKTIGPYPGLHIHQQYNKGDEDIEKPRKRRKINYVNDRDLLVQIALSKKDGKMNDSLAIMLMSMVERFATRRNFANYPYIDEMRAYAIERLVQTWAGFKPEKSDHPFGYYSKCIERSFVHILNKERRQRDLRDAGLVAQGLEPSYTYTAKQKELEIEKRNSEKELEEFKLKERSGDYIKY